ncbi:MAG: hypothetical protein NC340_05440 [Ruminococcus flavefaciens]|nr:hypothetical protein [Ruminococcus flavefaciens]MCM1229562.1 hypothetical protein [Ruminococcus flavefaciens]
MTFPTTDSPVLVVVISVAVFIAVSVISGIIAYKLKLRKLRQNKEKDDDNVQT